MLDRLVLVVARTSRMSRTLLKTQAALLGLIWLAEPAAAVPSFGFTRPGISGSSAYFAISDDGSHVGGWIDHPVGVHVAVAVGTPAIDLSRLQDFNGPPIIGSSAVTGFSPDGSTATGVVDTSRSDGYEAFQWTQEGGVEFLGVPAPAPFPPEPLPIDPKAIESWALRLGVLERANGTIEAIYDVTPDGSVYVGVGSDADSGYFQGFVFVTPEPSTGALAGLGLLALSGYAASRRVTRRSERA